MTCLTNPYMCMKGVCTEVNGTGGLVVGHCVCDQGWENDNAMFHQDNCGIPTNALLAIFVVYGIGVAFPLLGLFVRATMRARGRMRQTGIIAATSCLTFTATALSLYLERGVFEATCILLTVNLAVTNYIGESVLMMMLAPIVAVRHRHLDKSVPRKLRRIMWGIRCILLINGIVLAALCRTSYFNYAIVALNISNVFLAFASSLPQLRYVTLLQEAITKSLLNTNVAPTAQEGPQKAADVMTRLTKSKNGLIAYCCHIFFFQFTIVGLFLGLGHTLPFVWCIWPLLFLSQFVKYYQCLVLFQQNPDYASVSDSKGRAGLNSRKLVNQEVLTASHAPPSESTI